MLILFVWLKHEFPFLTQCFPPLWVSSKGVAERGSRTKGWGGRVRPKAEKKKVTSPILMAEVVADVPEGTSDGSARVQYVFELL
jgi:hypothetical protein